MEKRKVTTMKAKESSHSAVGGFYNYTILAHFPLTHGHLRPPIAASKNIFFSVSYFGNKLACRNRYVRSSCRLLVIKYSTCLQQLYVDQRCSTKGLTRKSTSTV